MLRAFVAIVYTSLLLGANPALADRAALQALLEDDMRKLVLHETPRPASAAVFVDAEGAQYRLSDWAGKVVVLNFWATWCAPCRKEMPALAALEAEFGGDRFAVVPIATGRNSLPGIRKFLSEVGIENLPVLLDPRSDLARSSAVIGLPATLVLNAEGQEIGRMIGEADWHSASAVALVRALLDQ